MPLVFAWLLAAVVTAPALHAQARFDGGAKPRPAVAPTYLTGAMTSETPSIITGAVESRTLHARSMDDSSLLSWIGGVGGCRAVTLRWTALGAVLGLVMPLARHAVGADRPSSGDFVASTVIGTSAGVVTGALLCHRARTG